MKFLIFLNFLTINIFFFNNFAFSQNEIELILKNIYLNNKQINSNNELLKYKSMEYRTGLAPADPQIGYDYLFGSPKDAGNQAEFNLKFTFDFPTVYSNKNKLAQLKSEQLTYDFQSFSQEILFKAKLLCIELIYLNIRKTVLENRLHDARNLLELFNTKLQKGDGNILDLNKAKLQVLNLNNELELNQIEINKSINKLTELNGGKPVTFNSSEYPTYLNVPDFVSLEKEIESIDPFLKNLKMQYDISKQEIQIDKDLNLPKFEVGYRYQGIINQNFHGVQFGISIPLWERSNIVKTKELKSLYSLALIDEHKLEHYYETKNLYEQFISLRTSLKIIDSTVKEINSIDLLQKSFSLGEISAIELFMELSYFFSIIDQLHLIEKELNIVATELFKFRLINFLK